MRNAASVFCLVAGIGAGCSPAPMCSTVPCGSASGKPIQVCVNGNKSVTYEFGGTTCTCSEVDCPSCLAQTTPYCGPLYACTEVPDAGSSCTITVSGAYSRTFSCAASTTYDVATGLGGVTLDSTCGLSASIMKPGMLQSSSWTNSDSGAVTTITMGNADDTGAWAVSVGNRLFADTGSYTMNVTVSDCMTIHTGDACTGHGTLTATLPAEAGTKATGTVMLTATF